MAVRRTICAVRNIKRPKRRPETKEHKTLPSMSISKDLHVTQTGENTEVEDDSQTQAETKEGVHDDVRERTTNKIVVHTAGGRIEVEIPVRQAQQDPG